VGRHLKKLIAANRAKHSDDVVKIDVSGLGTIRNVVRT
jgi:hypothetical protein